MPIFIVKRNDPGPGYEEFDFAVVRATNETAALSLILRHYGSEASIAGIEPGGSNLTVERVRGTGKSEVLSVSESGS